MREIPAPDGAAEEQVANQRQFRFRLVEDDVPGRVAGAVAHVESQVADRHLIAVGKPSRWLEWLAGNAVLGAVLSEAVDPVNVGLMRTFDRHPEILGKNARAAAMVDVAVG